MLTLPLKSNHTLKDLSILPGTLTQMKILITLFILMAMAIVKIPRQPLITQLLTWTTNPTKSLLVTSPQQTCSQHLMYATLMTPKPKNTVIDTTPNLMNSRQLG